MRIISGDVASLQPDLMTGVARYRYEVFVQRLGWKLRCQDGLEYDQYDREETVYVVALDKRTGEIKGTARLLPTTKPYLLREIFPELLCGLPAPESADTWELSRFAAVDLKAPVSAHRGQFSSGLATALLRATLACAAERGARQLVTVSPVGVKRLLRRAGFAISGIAPPVAVGQARLFACRIEIKQNDSGWMTVCRTREPLSVREGNIPPDP